MGILDGIRAAWSAPSVSDDGHWSTIGGGAVVATNSGVAITEDVALANPVVWDSVHLLKDQVAQCPTILYDRTGVDLDERQKATSRLAWRLHEQPNDEQSAFEFKSEMQQAASFYRWAYAEIEWRGGIDPVCTPRHPNRVRVASTAAGKRYEYLEDDGRTWRPILPADMLRIPGRPVLRFAAETLGHAIALERHSTNLFGRGFRPGVAVEVKEGVVFDEAAKARYKAAMQEAHSGKNSGGIFWPPDGTKVVPWGMTNQEAEFKDIRNALVGSITRFWHIPPYMVGLLESGTVSYASVNTQGIDFVVYTLMPWFVGWEQALSRDLLVDRRGQFVEFLAAQLLRGTTKERYEVYKVAIQNGIMSVNEVRRLENLNPRAGGDAYLQPLNMAPAARHVEPGSPADRLLTALTQDAAGRVVRREQGALAKLAERTGTDPRAWEAGVRDFYAGHGATVSELMKVRPSVAASWADRQMWEVLSEGPHAAAAWNGEHADRLAQLALTEPGGPA